MSDSVDNELKIGTFNLNRSSMIEASAGTGKTYTITYLVLRLLLGSEGFDEKQSGHRLDYGYHAGPLELKNILVVTFTKAAASDLKARIREKIVTARSVFEKVEKKGIDILDCLELEDQMEGLVREMLQVRKVEARVCALLLLNAERSIDEAPICTIHSFCARALHKIYAFEAGESFGVQLCEDISEQSSEAKNTVWRELFYKGDENSRKLAALLSVESDDRIFDTLKSYQHKLERVRNTDEKDGFFGYNLKNIRFDEGNDITKTVDRGLKKIDRFLEEFVELADKVRSVFNEYEVITDNDEPGALFTRFNGATPQFKQSSKAGYRLLRDLCLIKDEEELNLAFIRSCFPDGENFHSISRVTDQNKYPEIFANAQMISELEALYMNMAKVHDKVADIKNEIMFDIAIMVEQKTDEILRRDNLVGFDGIIRRLDYVLNYKAGSKDTLPRLIRSSYPVAMIDEFQDTDPVQFSIFSKLYLCKEAKNSGTCCYLIGDPKQSIYGFRKADIHSYLKARGLIETYYGRDAIYTLNTNFRSQEQIVDGVNRIFSQREDPFFFEKNSLNGIEFSKVKANVKSLGNSGKYSFRFCNEKDPSAVFSAASNYVEFISKDEYLEYGESAGISKQKDIVMILIARKLAVAVKTCLSHGLLDSVSGNKIVTRTVKPSDIAILVRSGTEAWILQQALKERGIASVYYSDKSKVFDDEESSGKPSFPKGEGAKKASVEYELILYLLEAMDDYANRGKVRRLLLSQLCRASILAPLDEDSVAMELEVALLKECREIWEKNGFFPAFSKWANNERHQCLKENLSFTGGERMVTNLWHLAELLQSARSHEQGIQAQKRWYKELRSNPLDYSDADMFSRRLESEASQVAIYTIFKSKGLEFPLVFLPYLWTDIRAVSKDDAFYYDETESKLYFDILANASTIAQKKKSDLQEDARLLYVALTRACAANFMYIPQVGVKNPNSLISEFLTLNSTEDSSEDSSRSGTKSHAKPSEGFVAYLNAKALFEGKNTGVLEDRSDSDENRDAEKEQKNPFKLVDDGFYEQILKEEPAAENTVSDSDISGPSEFSEDFSGIRQDYRISSYSGIVARCEDGGRFLSGLDTSISKDDLTPFNFPRSASAGTYLHSVMEYCDFSKSCDPAGIQEGIEKASKTNEAFVFSLWTADSIKGLPADEIFSRKQKALSDWIADVVQANLPCGDSKTVRLCDLKKGDWLCELEFLFPSESFDSDNLVELRDKNARLLAEEKGFALPEEMTFTLANNKLSGFVKGFIDLTFRTGSGDDSKFYVVDYKSNFMGTAPDDYKDSAVVLNMLEHCYDVQYLIYSLAMHRFLQSRIDNYSYDKHFGGVMYLYLRGMKKNLSNAVFYTKPKFELIEELSAIFGH